MIPSQNLKRKLSLIPSPSLTTESEKYELLGIHLDKEEISPDSIDSEIQTVNVVILVNNIKASNMSLDQMKLICDINKIDYKIEEEIL